jgi:hypothetical protein
MTGPRLGGADYSAMNKRLKIGDCAAVDAAVDANPARQELPRGISAD